MQSVLFVSKPIVPPFHDGAKCLVRDVAAHLSRYRPTVFTTFGAPPVSPGVCAEPIYPGAGSFAPTVSDNARVLRRLLLGRGDAIWHFVFAPNPASSVVAHVVRALRRVPTVQTIASAPRSFERLGQLLFGDRIVVLSEWMRDAMLSRGRFSPDRIRLIPPPVSRAMPSASEMQTTQRDLSIPEGARVITYPGDIERSRGARLVSECIPSLLDHAPNVYVVFACRKKSPLAEEAERSLRGDLGPYLSRVRFAGELPSLLPLLALSRVILFPVDDLYGKVDLPIALLESMFLGVPIVALDRGPLRELPGAILVPPDPVSGIARAVQSLLGDERMCAEIAEKGRAAARERHDPKRVAEAYEGIYDELVGRRSHCR